MDALVTGVCAASGLLLGDGLELVVERVGAKQPLDRPWFRCAACGAPARGLGLVPVARVLARRRGCPACGAAVPFAWRPAVLAVVTAAVLAGFALRFGADVALAPYAVLGVGLVALSAVDVERYILPNRILYPTMALVVALLVVASAVDHRWGDLARAAIGGAAAFAGMFAVHFAYPKGMGFGDVRLAGLVGLASGWLGLGHTFVAFFAAFVLAALVGLVAMAVTGQGRKTRIFFGPFLAAGAVVAVIWGNPLADVLLHHSTS